MNIYIYMHIPIHRHIWKLSSYRPLQFQVIHLGLVLAFLHFICVCPSTGWILTKKHQHIYILSHLRILVKLFHNHLTDTNRRKKPTKIFVNVFVPTLLPKMELLFSRSVIFNSLPPHGLQHVRLACPSLSPWVCSNSCSLSPWCHLTISSSIALSPPALSLFQHRCLFQWVNPSHQVDQVLEL